MPIWLHQRDLTDMRYGMGLNFQRTAHYPQDPAVYEFCDHNGIMVNEESPNIKDIAFGRDVQLQTMKEMIRRDRNHPSIIFWGIGNETDHPADSSWAWAEDKTRIINLRRGTNGGDHVMTTDEDLGLENTLRCTVRGWFNDDPHDFGPDTGEPASGQVTGTEEWQHTTDAEYLLKQANNNNDNAVVFLYADHGADRIYRNAPLHYVNPKGWVDGLRFPKYAYYLWQANFTQKPMAFIHSWPWQQRYIGRREPITIDSNADTVELFVGSRSLGIRKPNLSNSYAVQFDDVEVTNGTLRAVAHRNGHVVEQRLDMPGAPVRLALRIREQHLVADRSGLAIIEVDALDSTGHSVPYTHPTITWSISGQGTFVGPSDYVTDTDKNGAQTGTMYITLPTANIVRTTSKPGAIMVSVTSPDLASSSITMHSTEPPPDIAGIIEPPLNDRGRIPVKRDAAFASSKGATSVRVFDPVSQDYQIPAASLDEARNSMGQFLHEHNAKLHPDSLPYTLVLEKLSRLLFDNHGHLVADWYNFAAQQFTDIFALTPTINQSSLPQPMKDLLLRDYADRIITRGEAIDVQQESKLLQGAFANASVVSSTVIPGVKTTLANTLDELLSESYLQWKTLAPEQKARALGVLYRFNPALHQPGTDVTANHPLPNAPILLPSEKVLLH